MPFSHLFVIHELTIMQTPIAIIGNGFAGSFIAHQLHQIGQECCIIAPKNHKTSDNPAAIVRPFITHKHDPIGLYYYYAYQLWQSWIQENGAPDYWQQCGALEQNSRVITKALDNVCINNSWIKKQNHGWFFEQAGMVDGGKLCKYLIRDTHYIESRVTNLVHQQSQWRITLDNKKTIAANTVLIATNHATIHGLNTHWLDTTTVRGQLSIFRHDVHNCPTQYIVCDNKHLTPLFNHHYYAGATYSRDDHQLDVREDDHKENLTGISHWFDCDHSPKPCGAFVGLRTTAIDRRSIVGKLPKEDLYCCHHHDLQHGAPKQATNSELYYPHLYLSVAHGSRGVLSSFMASYLLMQQMGYSNDIPDTDYQTLLKLVAPERFLDRSIKRALR